MPALDERLDQRGAHRPAAVARRTPQRRGLGERDAGVDAPHHDVDEREPLGVDDRAEVDAEPVDAGEQFEGPPVGDPHPVAAERAQVEFEAQRADDAVGADEVAGEHREHHRRPPEDPGDRRDRQGEPHRRVGDEVGAPGDVFEVFGAPAGRFEAGSAGPGAPPLDADRRPTAPHPLAGRDPITRPDLDRGHAAVERSAVELSDAVDDPSIGGEGDAWAEPDRGAFADGIGGDADHRATGDHPGFARSDRGGERPPPLAGRRAGGELARDDVQRGVARGKDEGPGGEAHHRQPGLDDGEREALVDEDAALGVAELAA